MKIIEESIAVDTSIQLQFQRQNMQLESIFREFIDNSYDSYNNPINKEKLNAIGINKCYVMITVDTDKIIIEDKAFGMDHEAFKRALQLSKKSTNYHDKSLGQFGMGLKYAAISLGNEYTIESTALGSNEKYKARITRELLEQNSKTVENHVENIDENKHFTKITIRRLIKKIKGSQLDKLRYDLGKIYHKFIGNNDLEIVFLPNLPVQYREPELWINDDGNEYNQDFEGKFEFDGKEYVYFGWIGILKVGDTKGDGSAGFSLYHKGRIIDLNYRNEDLLGRANSFPYQRLVGDIHLDDFPVDFNKSAFSWNNGLETAFIESLKSNIIFSEMKKITNNLRKRTSKKNPNKEDISKINSKQSKIFEKLASSKKTVVSSTVPKEDLPVVYKEENVAPLKVTYESVDYTFFIEYTEEVDLSKEWLKISVLDDENHEYLVKINNNFNVFGKIKVSDRELIQTFVMIITLAQLSSVRLGYKESYKFVEKMNEIIKLLG